MEGAEAGRSILRATGHREADLRTDAGGDLLRRARREIRGVQRPVAHAYSRQDRVVLIRSIYLDQGGRSFRPAGDRHRPWRHLPWMPIQQESEVLLLRPPVGAVSVHRSEEHTSELQS